MTNREALEVLEKSDRCAHYDCPDVDSCVVCPYNVSGAEFGEAYDMAKKALADSVPKFHLQCLMCKGDVGSYSAQTMEQVSYTHYSYCEDCLRKGLKLLKEQDVPDTNVGDMVSRQTVLDALDEIETEVANGEWNYAKWRRYFCGEQSAQPEPIKINIEDFNKEDWERLKKECEKTPITVLPAQPEIIRCKDCKYWREHKYAKETKK